MGGNADYNACGDCDKSRSFENGIATCVDALVTHHIRLKAEVCSFYGIFTVPRYRLEVVHDHGRAASARQRVELGGRYMGLQARLG
jgi:hypothetical protein